MPTENRSSNTEQMVRVPRELMPCRFCGGKADSRCTAGPYPDWFVECVECLASAPVFSEEKLDGWNNRAQPAAQHQEDPMGMRLRPGGTISNDIPPGQAGHIAIGLLDSAPPTSDGFSAGDMADQGAKAFAARDGEVQELRAKLAEAQEVLRDCIEVGELDAETQWKAERVSKGRRLYVDDRALANAAPSDPE
ncbi:hypothetical protein [Pseudomonas sp. BBP2017]|uniref:hypothetical protein n=1 Tax=Pseudomonas sp. BBP2017 TaxID=2109731 RepID=UPI000D132BFD|nr:hypothetical protein [Pseudomonas sp. BBP2017]PSS51649.1 hypothetical protein C6382_17355 [Pseudomonas sp. BBP2017]